MEVNLEQAAGAINWIDTESRLRIVDKIVGDVEDSMALVRQSLCEMLRTLVAEVPVDHRPHEDIGQFGRLRSDPEGKRHALQVGGSTCGRGHGRRPWRSPLEQSKEPDAIVRRPLAG